MQPIGIEQIKGLGLRKTLLAAGAFTSNGEGRRLLKQGAVDVNGTPIASFDIELDVDSIILVGKHRKFWVVSGEVTFDPPPEEVKKETFKGQLETRRTKSLKAGERIHQELVEWHKVNAPEWLPGGKHYKEYQEAFREANPNLPIIEHEPDGLDW